MRSVEAIEEEIDKLQRMKVWLHDEFAREKKQGLLESNSRHSRRVESLRETLWRRIERLDADQDKLRKELQSRQWIKE